jgi:ATP-dependent Clp protease protease subunit
MILKINREICSEDDKVRLWFQGRDGISFDDVDSAINWMDPSDNTIELMMNSLGGDCDEGFAIYDKLRSTGKEIKAIIQGHCGSMASVILLAASDRKAFPHATLHIHRPYLSFYADHFGLGDADSAKAQLEDLNTKILDIYEERTGTDRATLEAIMDEDRDMKPEEAKELGFINEIMLPASASAYYNQFSNKTQNTMTKKSKIATAFLALGKALGLSNEEIDAKDYVLTTEDGTEITIDIAEGEEPKVGDPASPDGTFTLNDGRVITIEGGVITEIKPAEEDPEEGETKEELKAKIADLERQLEEAKAKDTEIEALKANAKTEDDIKAIDFVTKAGGIDALAKMQSNYKPQGRTNESHAQDVVEETMLQKELREKKEARAKRNN